MEEKVPFEKDLKNEGNKVIYFIYSQINGEENDVGKLEGNENIKDIQIIKQDKKDEYINVLYSVTLSNNNHENMISLFLTKENEKFEVSIDCFESHPRIFIYEVDYKHLGLNLNLNNNFEQFTLPYASNLPYLKMKLHFIMIIY